MHCCSQDVRCIRPEQWFWGNQYPCSFLWIECDRFHITKLHFFMMCVDIVSYWSRYNLRSLIHGEQITVSLHTVMLVTVVLWSWFWSQRRCIPSWRGSCEACFAHPVLYTAKGVLQDPDGIEFLHWYHLLDRNYEEYAHLQTH